MENPDWRDGVRATSECVTAVTSEPYSAGRRRTHTAGAAPLLSPLPWLLRGEEIVSS